MFVYTTSTTQATEPAPSPQHRADFAREATIAAFGPKAIHALDEPNVYSHRPNHGPRPLGQIAAKVADDTGIKAFRHWMAQAAKAESEEEREAAQKIAAEIARLLGLPGIGPDARKAT